ncbi:MAG: hypothetical protein L6R28_14195 [Planctomycetes bacterium]|nr:hypothetical protein [Planctomycetota bacterium]
MRHHRARLLLLLIATALFGAAGARAGALEEFKVKREAVYEFATPPSVARAGDRIEISFASKGRCDVTVAIENADGKIVRHLASGVLGSNAPAPFAKDSLAQKIVWDGKDDLGHYIDDKDSCIVRVSLGLKPQFERTLHWSPKKRIAPGNAPRFAAGPEGVYVQEGGGVDHIRLFDHDGNYVRTVYPFPPDYSSAEAKADSPTALQTALAKVIGLKWIEMPQDGKLYPEWQGIMYSTMLTSGDNRGTGTGRTGGTKYGTAASAMALQPPSGAGKPGFLALLKEDLNRVATDGTTGGLPLKGPKTWFEVPKYGLISDEGHAGDTNRGYPRSAAFSPDGKWLYMTGYLGGGNWWLPGVARMDFSGDKDPELFAGSMDVKQEGSDTAHFKCPMSVACDSKGRVYVADSENNRIQVFGEDGKFLKSLGPVTVPIDVFVHPKTGHIYVASWMMISRYSKDRVKAVLTHYGPLEDFKPVASYPLPFSGYSEQVFMNRTSKSHGLFIDFYTEPPTIWVVPGSGDTTERLMQNRRTFANQMWGFSRWSAAHYRLYQEKGGKLVEKANFAKDVAEAITRIDPPATPAHGRQRMYVNPNSGLLYVAETDGAGVGKAVKDLLVIDPKTGKAEVLKLPFTAEEVDFDLQGNIYLRTDLIVARFDLQSMREVPFDYGEERDAPGFDGDGKPLIAALRLPGTGRPGCFHLGGFGVAPNGNMVVSCYNAAKLELVTDGFNSKNAQVGKPYTPRQYPGRMRWAEVHVFDRYGKVVHEDAVPGLGMTDFLGIDRDDHIYAVAAARRLADGKDVLEQVWMSETLVKVKPQKAKVLNESNRNPVPLPKDGAPGRKPDTYYAMGGGTWIENPEWMYGGVCRDGFLAGWAPSCACWNSRAALDLFARSFATELARNCVAVLDTNGNLVMRIGKYGNVDDGVPLVTDGGPANPRSVGGDEVALAAPNYVASHTDHRLFIADYGNYRLLSVKLGYHAEQKIALKDVKDAGGE